MRSGHSQPHLSQCVADEIISSTFSVFVGLNFEFHHRHRQSDDSRDGFWAIYNFTIFIYIIQLPYMMSFSQLFSQQEFVFSNTISPSLTPSIQRRIIECRDAAGQVPNKRNLTRVSNEKWFSLGVFFFSLLICCAHSWYIILCYDTANLSPRIHSLAW